MCPFAQAKFRAVYGTQTYSNNNCWLRRKLMEGERTEQPGTSDRKLLATICGSNALPGPDPAALALSRLLLFDTCMQVFISWRLRLQWTLRARELPRMFGLIVGSRAYVDLRAVFAAAGLQTPKASSRGRPAVKQGRAPSPGSVSQSEGPSMSRSCSMASQQASDRLSAPECNVIRRTKRHGSSFCETLQRVLYMTDVCNRGPIAEGALAIALIYPTLLVSDRRSSSAGRIKD